MTLPSSKPRPPWVRTGIPAKGGASDLRPHSTASRQKRQTANASYLAHDARNWMTVLQVYCDLLHTPGAVAEGYQAWMEELSGAVKRGRLLVDSLLDSIEVDEVGAAEADAAGPAADRMTPTAQPGIRSDVQSGVQFDTQPLDLAAALTRRLPLLRQLAGDRIQVEINAPQNAGKVGLSESAFERILYNLVGNAIEAMPEGGGLRISVQAAKPCGDRGRRPGKAVLLRVEDTGTGIDSRRLPYIFDAGVSGKSVRASNPERRGYGLAIVRQLAQSAGGDVRVRSHPGRGSCFEIELPEI